MTKNYLLRYTLSDTDAQSEPRVQTRHLSLRSRLKDSALIEAHEHAISLSNDLSLDGFTLVCPDGDEIKIILSGVERSDESALADLRMDHPFSY